MGDGPPLLFIHGAGTPGTTYAEDLEELAGDCRVITYDRRGYGASGPPPETWREHTEDAARLLEDLDAAPATVAGYSAGAIVALDLALQRPDLVAGLVLLDPAVYTRRHSTPATVAAYVAAQTTRRLRGDAAGAKRWLRHVNGDAWDRMPAPRREVILANASGIFGDLGIGDGSHIETDRLKELEMPVTIVGCELSPPVLRKSVACLEEAIPQARSVAFTRSSHQMMLDARESTLDCLRSAVLAWRE